MNYVALPGWLPPDKGIVFHGSTVANPVPPHKRVCELSKGDLFRVDSALFIVTNVTSQRIYFKYFYRGHVKPRFVVGDFFGRNNRSRVHIAVIDQRL